MRSAKHCRRGFAALGFTIAAFGAVAVAPAAADTIRLDAPSVQMRGDYECDPGHEWVEMAAAAPNATVTHADPYEHYTGGTGEYETTAVHKTTVRAQLTSSVEVSFNHNLVFEKLNVKAGITLQVEGSKTTETSLRIKEYLSKNDTYVFYSGTATYTGQYSYYRCTSSGSVQFVTSGSVGSWKAETKGAVGCTQEVPSGSLAAKAKAQYCPPDDTRASVRLSGRTPGL